MRGKKAKQLRQTAEMMSIGSPKVEYEEIQHTNTHIDQDGHPFEYNIGKQVVLKLGCTRGVYQDLKRMEIK